MGDEAVDDGPVSAGKPADPEDSRPFTAFPGIPIRFVRPVRRVRRRHVWFDWAVRAAVRFDEVNAPRLSAAITYYAFLALFPLLLVSFSILGFALTDDATLTLRVETFLRQNLPGFPVTKIADAKNTAGVIGLLGFLYAGVNWVDCIRSSVRAVWRRNEFPGNFFVRMGIDILMLVALGTGLLFSVAVTVAISTGATWVLRFVGLANRDVGDITLNILGFVLGFAVNVLIFLAFLAGLPRIKVGFRRLVVPAFLGALGLEGLKTIGRLYIERTQSNAAYAVVAGTVGLLIFLHLFDQLLLYCAALTAVSSRRPTDPDDGEADEPPPDDPPDDPTAGGRPGAADRPAPDPYPPVTDRLPPPTGRADARPETVLDG